MIVTFPKSTGVAFEIAYPPRNEMVFHIITNGYIRDEAHYVDPTPQSFKDGYLTKKMRYRMYKRTMSWGCDINMYNISIYI